MNRRQSILLFAFAFSLCVPAAVFSQTSTPMSERDRRIKELREQRAKKKAASAQAEKEEELGPPESVSITTKDKVILSCMYYPGAKSKETIPIILLHDWGSSRQDLLPMAEYLQKTYKHSVIVPDLRGHGDSVRVEGFDKQVDYKKFKKNEVSAVVNDIERCKKFLMKRNNEGELNIEMLSIVAIGKLAVPAVDWCIADWEWQPVGGRKQGQDVKAILMISPEQKLKGMNMKQSLKSNLFSGRNGATPIAFYAVWSENDEVRSKEGATISKLMKKQREKLTDQLMAIRRPYEKTGLNGTDLVRDPRHKVVYDDIHKFLQFYLINNKEQMPWQNRARK